MSKTDLNVMKQPFGPMVRTPGVNQSRFNLNIASPPPAPIYHPGYHSHLNASNLPYDITKTVSSVVDNLEADLAKNIMRRPSGQFESRKILLILVKNLLDLYL